MCIRDSSNRWKTFVANRVCEIQELTQGCIWQHVPSKDNPADIVSRGCSPSVLTTSSLWWHGPKFLKEEKEYWPSIKCNISNIPAESLNEEKKQGASHTFLASQNMTELTEPFSSLSRALRVFAYCRRFLYNARNPDDRITSSLSLEEINSTMKVLIRQTQLMYFSHDIHELKERKYVSNKSKLVSLNPFLDEEDLIRVGGRLNLSKFTIRS